MASRTEALAVLAVADVAVVGVVGVLVLDVEVMAPALPLVAVLLFALSAFALGKVRN